MFVCCGTWCLYIYVCLRALRVVLVSWVVCMLCVEYVVACSVCAPVCLCMFQVHMCGTHVPLHVACTWPVCARVFDIWCVYRVCGVCACTRCLCGMGGICVWHVYVCARQCVPFVTACDMCRVQLMEQWAGGPVGLGAEQGRGSQAGRVFGKGTVPGKEPRPAVLPGDLTALSTEKTPRSTGSGVTSHPQGKQPRGVRVA